MLVKLRNYLAMVSIDKQMKSMGKEVYGDVKD